MNKIAEFVSRYSRNFASTYQRIIIAIQNSAERIATHQSATDFQPQFEQYQRLYPNFEDYRCKFEPTFSKHPSPNEPFTDALIDNVAVQEFLEQYKVTLDVFLHERVASCPKMPPISVLSYESAPDFSASIAKAMTFEVESTNAPTIDKKIELKDKKQQLFKAKQKLAQCRSEIKRLKTKMASVKNQIEEVRKIKVQLMMKYDEVQVAKLSVMKFDLEILALENELILSN